MSNPVFGRNKSKKGRANLSPLLAAIKKCGQTKDIEQGRKIHCALGEDVRDNVYVKTSLVSMYSKCGRVVEARRVFDEMEHSRSVVTWTALMLGYVEARDGRTALDLFFRMQLEGFSPNARTFVAALKACVELAEQEKGGEAGGGAKTKGRSYRTGAAVHTLLSGVGLSTDVFLASCLVEMYAKCGRTREARVAFDAAPSRDVVLWSCMILAYTDNAEEELALDCFGRMQSQGCPPNAWTFAVAFKACIGLARKEEGTQVDGKILKLRALQKGADVHSRAAASGFDEEKFVASSMIAMYSKCGTVVDARAVFDKLKQRDIVVWNALIDGYVENEEGNLALEVYERMDCSPDAGTFISALKASGAVVAMEAGKRIHAQVCRRGLEQDETVATCLVDFYGKCGSMLEAQQGFDSLCSKDVVGSTALIAGYSRKGDVGRVLDLFSGMAAEGLRADEITLVCVLALCSHAGLSDQGKRFFDAIRLKYGLAPVPEHYHCMVDMFGRSNQLDAAVSMAKSMPDSSSVAWLTVLGACVKLEAKSEGKLALKHLTNFVEVDAAACVFMEKIYRMRGGVTMEQA